MSREAMQLALEALEFEASGWEDVPPITRDAITTLREALETEQKPVISTDHGPWIPSTHPGEEGETYCKRCLLRDKFFGSRQCDPHIVYTAPQKREWVGLTDEERHSIREWRGIQKELGPVWAPMLLYLYEAIEAKLREKNHG